MTGSASIWAPSCAITANNSIRHQRFVAAANQTIFNLTDFQYVPDSGALFVFVSSGLQCPGVDYTQTSVSSFTLGEPLAAGTIVLAVAFVEVIGGFSDLAALQNAVTAAQAAAASAAASSQAAGGEGFLVYTTPTAPTAPSAGSIWLNPEDGVLYIWYVDADSGQWISPIPIPFTPPIPVVFYTVPQIPIIAETPSYTTIAQLDITVSGAHDLSVTANMSIVGVTAWPGAVHDGHTVVYYDGYYWSYNLGTVEVAFRIRLSNDLGLEVVSSQSFEGGATASGTACTAFTGLAAGTYTVYLEATVAAANYAGEQSAARNIHIVAQEVNRYAP